MKNKSHFDFVFAIVIAIVHKDGAVDTILTSLRNYFLQHFHSQTDELWHEQAV